MAKAIKIVLGAFGAIVAFIVIAILSVITPDIAPSEIDHLYKNENSQIITLPSGQKVHIRDEGRKNGAPIVLLHGSNASLHTWEPWVERLGDRYRIITLDFPAHGLTGPDIINEDYSLASYIRFVDAVTTQLKLEQFVLGGNSMGGNVSWRYALAYPHKVRGLILVDSSGYQIEARDGPLIFKLLRFAPFRWLFQKIHLHSIVEEGVRNAYNNAPVVTDKLIKRYADLNLRQGQRRANALRFARPRKHSPPPRGIINVPTLILWGKKDTLTPVSMARKFNRDLPNSALVIYDNVGHIPNEEIPGRSARDVRAFLEGMSWGLPPAPAP